MKNSLFLTQKNHSAIKGDKFARTLAINLEGKHSRLVLARNLKSVTSLKIANAPNNDTKVYNQLRILTSQFSKTVKSLSITNDDSNIPIRHFHNVTIACLDLEPTSPTSPSDEKPVRFSYDRIKSLGKLKTLTVNLFAWDQLWRLSRFRHLETLSASSTLKDLQNIRATDFQNSKLAGLKYIITISSNDSELQVELPTKFLEKVRGLTVSSTNTELPVLGNQAHNLTGMKALTCNMNPTFLKNKSQELEKFCYLRQLDRLNLDFSMNAQATSEFLNHVVFPTGLRQLKLTFSNCKYSVLENADTNLTYFQSISTLKNLSVFEFEAFRLSLFKESKTTCINFIKNTLKSMDTQLSALSLKAPAATEPDDEFYELLLSQSTLSHMELGIAVAPTEAVLPRIREFRGNLRSLKLSNNSILFEVIPREALLNLEELSIYLGIHTDLSQDEKFFQNRFVNMLKKIRSLKKIENLNLYNSVGVSKSKKNVLKELATIMKRVPGLKTMSVGMRSMKLEDNEKCGLEYLSTQKKFHFSNFKFSNVEFGTA